MNEDIIHFSRDIDEEYPFCILMTGISYCDGNYRIERKNSSLYVMEYILKGQGTVTVNGTTFYPASGSIYILPEGSDHIYYSGSKDPWVKIWFNIKGLLIDSLMQIYRLDGINLIEGLNIEELFYKFYYAAQSNDTSRREKFNKTAVIFHEIVAKISSYIHSPKLFHSPEAVKLKNYIDGHIKGDIRIKDLGNQIFRSPSQTIRIFKKEFGLTPYDYFLIKKIDAAKLLLQNTNLTVKEIALRLHFADEHYFSNCFKSKTGQSPLAFRRVI